MNELERQARAEHRAILRRWLIIVLAMLGLAAGSVAAGIPSQVAQLLLGIGPVGSLDTVPRHYRYNGYLEIGGQPVHTPDAGTLMVARFFSFPDAGPSLWSQTQRVPVTNGRFTLELGDEADGGIRAYLPRLPVISSLFIELTVGSGPAVTLPRQQVLSLPYAMRSSDVITDDRVLTIGTGGDFANLTAALTWLNLKVVRGSVTLRLLDGPHSTPATTALDHPDGARIKLIGNLANPSAVVLNTPGSGFSITAPFGQLAGFQLVGPGNLSTTTGIRVVSSSVELGPDLSVQGYEVGVESLFGQVNLNDVQITGRGNVGFGAFISRGGQFQAVGCTIANAHTGVYADGAGVVRIDSTLVTDTTNAIITQRSCQMEISGTTQINNALGNAFNANNGSFIRIGPMTTLTGTIGDPYYPDLNTFDPATNLAFITNQ